MSKKKITVKPVSREEMECRIVFAVLMDSDIYKENSEFFKNYCFKNEFFGALAKTIDELYSDNNYDSTAVEERFGQKYGIKKWKMKSVFSRGFEMVKSFNAVKRYIKTLSKA